MIDLLKTFIGLILYPDLHNIPERIHIFNILLLMVVSIVIAVGYYFQTRFLFDPPINVGVPQEYIDKDEDEYEDSTVLLIHDRKKCVVCLERRPRYMFACGHLNICKKCFEKLENQTICPECRQECSIVYFKGKKNNK